MDKREKAGPRQISMAGGFRRISYSLSQLDDVIGYIQRQEEHHRKVSFRKEYLTYLERFNVAFDGRYVFEWIEEGK